VRVKSLGLGKQDSLTSYRKSHYTILASRCVTTGGRYTMPCCGTKSGTKTEVKTATEEKKPKKGK